MFADFMAPQTEVVDYGAFVADDFTKWSAGWTWTWNVSFLRPSIEYLPIG
jgi:hypothetical protein